MISKNRFGLPFILMAAMLTFNGMYLNSQDWPRWRGSNMDGIVRAPGVNLDWTQRKPTLAWTFRQAGAGYSAPVIVGTTLYGQGAADGNDFAFAVDTQTGNLKWRQVLGTLYVGGQNHGDGGRGSVTVDGDRLYLIRGGGQIHCLSATDGRMIWEKDFRRDFGGSLMSSTDWGYSESPLVDGNLVICTPGGNQGAMVALDKTNGNVVWRSREWTDLGGYSSPIVAEIQGVRQFIQLTQNGVAGIAASDGRLLWKADVGGNNTAAIFTPVYHDNIVYVTSGYQANCAAIRLTRTGNTFNTEILYSNRNMVNQLGGVILLDGHIYGFSDTNGWACQNLITGENVWAQRDREVTKGSVVAVNNRLIVFNEANGLITVLAASPEGFREFGRMEIPARSSVQTARNFTWTHPVVANGKLYIRDHDLIFCFNL